jgi:hypothetical protein
MLAERTFLCMLPATAGYLQGIYTVDLLISKSPTAGYSGLINISHMLQLNTARFIRKDLPHYCFGDTRDFHHKNIVSQPKDWPWRSRVVNYTLNTQGFRCPEFDSIDWANSIVCFGCSMTFGMGVDDSDTWVSQLGRELNCNTVNLGWPGASPSFMWANSIELARAGIQPRAVVYYWPEPSRVSEFIRSQQVYNWGIWDEQKQTRPWEGSLGKCWVEKDYHARTMARYQIASIKWSCPTVHLTWAFDGQFEGLAEHLHILEDRARDLGHPGPYSQGQFARQVSSRIQSAL